MPASALKLSGNTAPQDKGSMKKKPLCSDPDGSDRSGRVSRPGEYSQPSFARALKKPIELQRRPLTSGQEQGVRSYRTAHAPPRVRKSGKVPHTRKDTPRPTLACGSLSESPILPDDCWLDSHTRSMCVYDEGMSSNEYRVSSPEAELPIDQAQIDSAVAMQRMMPIQTSACASAFDPSSDGSNLSQDALIRTAPSAYNARTASGEGGVSVRSADSLRESDKLRQAQLLTAAYAPQRGMLCPGSGPFQEPQPMPSMCESVLDPSTISSVEPFSESNDLLVETTRDTSDLPRREQEEEWVAFCSYARAGESKPDQTSVADGNHFNVNETPSGPHNADIGRHLDAPGEAAEEQVSLTCNKVPQRERSPYIPRESHDNEQVDECTIVYREEDLSSAESDVPLMPPGKGRHGPARSRRRQRGSESAECAGIFLWILCMWKRCFESMLNTFYSSLWEKNDRSPDCATRDSFFWP